MSTTYRVKAKTFIIKAQRAIYPPNSPAVIYNEDCSVTQYLPFEGALSEAMGNRYKAYFEVHIDDAGILHLHREVFGLGW
jgi:hypothetical protein